MVLKVDPDKVIGIDSTGQNQFEVGTECLHLLHKLVNLETFSSPCTA